MKEIFLSNIDSKKKKIKQWQNDQDLHHSLKSYNCFVNHIWFDLYVLSLMNFLSNPFLVCS